MVQPRKTRPYITERLLMGHKESNQKLSHWYPGSGVVLDCIDSLLTTSTNMIIYLHYLEQILIIKIVCTNTIIYLQYLIPIPIIDLLRISHFPTGMLGQVWYLIVSIPDLCTLAYFYNLGEINHIQII